MDPMCLSPPSPLLLWLQDLIKNHLVMALYNHAAIWRGRTDRMPQGFFTNGHVLVDGEKMSKSAGNFITLLDGIKRWSADAYVCHELNHHTSVLNQACCADVRVVCVALHRCRITLALAGDSLNDANFECHTADSMVQRLVRGTLIVCCCCCVLHGVRTPRVLTRVHASLGWKVQRFACVVASVYLVGRGAGVVPGYREGCC